MTPLFMESVMAGSSEQLIQAQQEKTVINELFANSVFSSTTHQESPGYLLAQLHQAKADFYQYGESFDSNGYKRCLKIVFSSLFSAITSVALLFNNGWVGGISIAFTLTLFFYYFFSHESRHDYQFLIFFKKGKAIDKRVKEYKKRLLPIVSSKDFQFKILYQLQMLGEKIAHDMQGVNQGWIMERHNKLKLAFNNKDYEDCYTVLDEIYQNHELIHNKLLQKIDMVSYEQELEEFVTRQKKIDLALPFEHHAQQLKELL